MVSLKLRSWKAREESFLNFLSTGTLKEVKSQDQIPCVKQIKATHSPVPGSRILKGAEPGLSVHAPLCSSLGPSVKPLGRQETARKPPILPSCNFTPEAQTWGGTCPCHPVS